MLVAVALLLAVVLLLAVPLEVAFQLAHVGVFRGRISFRWLFGLVRVRLAVPRARPTPTGPKAGRRAARKPPRRSTGAGALAVLRQAAFRRRVARLVRDLLRAIHVRRLRLLVRLGLEDPADTGRLWGFVGPLGAALQNLRGAEVRIEPSFIDPVLELEARGRVRLVPLRILTLASCFALSPPSIRAWLTSRGGGHD